MNIENVVRIVEVRGQVQGMDQVARGYDQVAASSVKTADATAQAAAAQRLVEQALASTQRQLQDNLNQQQRYTDALKQQTQALQSIGAANDNAQTSTRNTGLEFAEVANHLRQAAEAAYFFSPAFRAVVNGMAAPALAAAGTGLELVATGLVRGTNLAGSGLISLAAATDRVAPGLTGTAALVRSAGVAMEAFNPTVAGVAGSLLTKLIPAFGLLSKALLIYDAIKLVGEAWELSGQKLEEYRKIAENAAKLDLSTDFFQRITKGATDANLKVDDLTKAMQTLVATTADKLGQLDANGVGRSITSTVQDRLDLLVKSGNFAGNSGVDDFANAKSTEDKFKAIVSLIHQAMDDGQRLAAIDIAGTAFGPEAAQHLRDDAEYFDKLLQSAQDVAATELVSPADIGRAIDLNNRYEAAVKLLEQRWHPIQDLLIAGGIKMREIWVGIVEAVASAFDGLFNLVKQIGDWLQPYMDYLKTAASLAAKVASFIPGPVGAAATVVRIAAAAPGTPQEEIDAQTRAYEKLANAQQTANAAQKNIIDTSHGIVTAHNETKNALDRAIDSIEKYIQTTEAAAKTVGAGAFEQEKAKTIAQLTAAAQRDGKTNLDQYAQAWEDLGNRAGTAAQKLALSNATSKADFQSQIQFMSTSEQSIATVLNNIYGPTWKEHLNDALVDQMRMNNLLKESKDTALDFTKTLVQGLISGQKPAEALNAAVSQLATKMGDKAITDIFSGNFVQGGIEGIIAAGAAIFSGDQKQKKELADAQAAWAKMTAQMANFNLAAKGIELGPLTSQLQSLLSTYQQLREAAQKAHDWNSSTQLDLTFIASAKRVVDEFQNGVTTLNPLAQAIKDVNDEAAGLQATLANIGSVDLSGLSVATQARIQAVMAQYTDQLNQSLAQRLNSARSKDYLNQAADLLKQRQQDLDEAAILGNNPTMLASIQATFAASAQKIIEDAGLVGDSFNDFIKLFPDFSGVVTQSATAIAAANDKFAALTKTINDYLTSIEFGDKSILSPDQQLAAAQQNFSQQLALAQGGNSDALGSITSYASTLLDQAKSYYASSSGYADIYKAVTSALGALTGTSGYSVGSSSSAALTSPALTQSSSTVQQIVQSSASSNDNSAAIAAQTQTLVQAIGAAATAEIQALRDEVATLRDQNERLIAAVQGRRANPARPAAKAAS